MHGDTGLCTSQTESRHYTKQKTGLGWGSGGSESGGDENKGTSRSPASWSTCYVPNNWDGHFCSALGEANPEKYYVSMTFL